MELIGQPDQVEFMEYDYLLELDLDVFSVMIENLVLTIRSGIGSE